MRFELKITFVPLVLLAANLGAAAPTLADTHYPLTLENCGSSQTFTAAPASVVSAGQATTEILYSLGLGAKVAGTGVWFTEVLAEFKALNAGIARLADNDPSFESILAKRPGLVTAQYEWHIGPQGIIAPREQFADLGIATYILPADCIGKDNSAGSDGTRLTPYTMAGMYQGIEELAAIFNISETGNALVAALQAREAAAVASAQALGLQEASAVFWFSSAEMGIDPYVAGNGGAPAWMMHSLGLKNIIDSAEEWPVVSWETIARANPDVIVLARMDRRRFEADDVEKKLEFLKSDPVARQMQAVKRNRILLIDAHAMDPSIRNISALEALAQALPDFDLQ